MYEKRAMLPGAEPPQQRPSVPIALRVLMGILVAGVVALVCPSSAYAGDVEDFSAAMQAYEAREYQRATELFQLMVGGPTPRISSRPLILESRKYYAASLVMTGRGSEAREQLLLLIGDEPDYQIDPTEFPQAVVELFSTVQSEVRARQQQVLEEERRRTRAETRDARWSQLVQFAEAEVVTDVENSRWLALTPLGVGQFQNGNETLGWFFLISELGFGGAAAATLFIHQSLVGQLSRNVGNAEGRLGQGNELLNAMFVANWVSVGVTILLAVVGVIDAQVRFVERRQYRRRREVPEGLRSLAQSPFAVTPGGLALRF